MKQTLGPSRNNSLAHNRPLRLVAACCNRFPPVTSQNSLRYPRDLAPLKYIYLTGKGSLYDAKVASAFGAIKACGIDRSCGVKEER